jgi:alkanesulfonate monooxygenase SsuD/methylene tetrahydromethanopterin reductase-like flavin-dependent oxidoreductase (luciferase family)
VDIELLSLGDHLPHPLTGELTPQSLRFRSIVESAVLAEDLGFSGVALGEHHFGRYIVSAPELLLSAIAVRTRRIRLGTAVTLLAHLDAVRAAEQLNTLDVLSQGRAQLTAARGVSSETCVAFGSPSQELRLRFDENLRLLLRLLTEDEVTWSGRFRAPLDKVHIEPRSVQRPHPPIWVGGGLSSISADLAAELGLPLMLPSMFWRPDHYVPLVERYRESMRAHGHEHRIRVGAASHVHVGRSTAAALSRWRPHLHAYATFANDLRGDGTPVDVDRLLEGPAVCGDPGEVTARLRAMQDALGLDVHLVLFDVGGLPEDELFSSLDLFGREVLPALCG